MPWLDSVSRMAWEFSWAPGICTRKELLPCCWTVAAEAPDALTRLVMTCCAWFIWSLVMAEPSLVDALRLTETPPWMSRPMVILSCGGYSRTSDAMSAARMTTRATTLPFLRPLRTSAGVLCAGLSAPLRGLRSTLARPSLRIASCLALERAAALAFFSERLRCFSISFLPRALSFSASRRCFSRYLGSLFRASWRARSSAAFWRACAAIFW